MAATAPMEERLQKIISRAGVASRRHAEQLILAGQVTVNGAVITELGSKADAERDSIKVAGKLLRLPEQKIYLVLNKPAECVATMSDPEGRKTLRDFVQGAGGRVFPVGRLDYHAEGLLLLTNDGELANELLRAKAMRQTFWLKVKSELKPEELRKAEQEGGARLRLMKRGANPWYEATLSGPRRDALRTALVELGHPVEKVRRVALGNLSLGNLAPGEYRILSSEEVQLLRRAISGAQKAPRPQRSQKERVRSAS